MTKLEAVQHALNEFAAEAPTMCGICKVAPADVYTLTVGVARTALGLMRLGSKNSEVDTLGFCLHCMDRARANYSREVERGEKIRKGDPS